MKIRAPGLPQLRSRVGGTDSSPFCGRAQNDRGLTPFTPQVKVSKLNRYSWVAHPP